LADNSETEKEKININMRIFSQHKDNQKSPGEVKEYTNKQNNGHTLKKSLKLYLERYWRMISVQLHLKSKRTDCQSTPKNFPSKIPVK
jgi:hypothetical protein